jgi:hypothetical protein
MTPYHYEREYFRITYPTAARPRFLAGLLDREVIDLCEMGIRYRAASDEFRQPGDEVRGIVRVRRGEELAIEGRVVPVDGADVALRLEVGIPLRVVIDEQRYLREHHRGSAW